MKKDPGIPNLFPYKDQILQEIEAKQQSKKEEAARVRDQAKARQEGLTVIQEQHAVEADQVDGASLRDHGDALQDGGDSPMDEVRSYTKSFKNAANAS